MLNKIKNLIVYKKINPSNKEIGLYHSIKAFKKTNSIFIHIPKSAGISIFRGIYGCDSFGHISINDYQSYLAKENLNDFFKYTIVRNPYDRLESAYFYLKNGGRKKKLDLEYQSELKKHLNYEDFITNFFKDDSYLEFEHFRPQYHWVINRKGEIELDYIGKFEKLNESFNFIKSNLKWSKELNKDLPLTNVNSLKKETKYTDEMINIINNIYQKDFEFFNYEIRV